MVTLKSPCRIQQGNPQRQRRHWSRVPIRLALDSSIMPAGWDVGLGLYGPQEVQRFTREMDATGLGMRFIAENPELSARIAREGAARAFKTQPMLPFHLGGRLGAGLLLGFAGLPWLPPFAMFGDAFRALEKGDDFISALGRGIAGTPSR